MSKSNSRTHSPAANHDDDAFPAVLAAVGDIDTCLDMLRRLLMRTSTVAPGATPLVRTAMTTMEKARALVIATPAR